MFQSGVPGHVLLADASHLYSIIACIVFSSIACILLRGLQVPEKSGQSWRRPLRREGPCASIRLLGQENIAKTPRAKDSKTTPKHKCTYPETGKTFCENSENPCKAVTYNYCILRGFGLQGRSWEPSSRVSFFLLAEFGGEGVVGWRIGTWGYAVEFPGWTGAGLQYLTPRHPSSSRPWEIFF